MSVWPPLKLPSSGGGDPVPRRTRETPLTLRLVALRLLFRKPRFFGQGTLRLCAYTSGFYCCQRAERSASFPAESYRARRPRSFVRKLPKEPRHCRIPSFPRHDLSAWLIVIPGVKWQLDLDLLAPLRLQQSGRDACDKPQPLAACSPWDRGPFGPGHFLGP